MYKKIILKLKAADNLLAPCSSKFGGMPDVWDDFMWPVATKSGYRKYTKDEYDLDFVCQINCAEAAEYDINGILPKTGLLYFFYASQTWKREQKYKTEVFYYDGDLSELIPYLPVDRDGNLLDTHPKLYDEPYAERWIERQFATDLAVPECAIDFEHESHSKRKGDDLYPHYLLGKPNEDEHRILPNNQQLLLQLEMLYGTLSICYIIDKKDLVNKDFEAAWVERVYD